MKNSTCFTALLLVFFVSGPMQAVASSSPSQERRSVPPRPHSLASGEAEPRRVLQAENLERMPLIMQRMMRMHHQQTRSAGIIPSMRESPIGKF